MAAKHFIVTDKKDGTRRLVQASNKAAALQHVIGDAFHCEVAKASDVISMLEGAEPVKVEIAEKSLRSKDVAQESEKNTDQQSQ